VDLPSLPNPGEGGGTVTPSGSVSNSLNGAAFAGFEIEKSKWWITGTFLWADLSASHTVPKVTITSNAIYGQL
jgi:hypothetical protein